MLVPLKGLVVWPYNLMELECSALLLVFKSPFIFLYHLKKYQSSFKHAFSFKFDFLKYEQFALPHSTQIH